MTRRVFALITAATALALTACGSSGSSQSNGTSTSGSAGSSSSGSAAAANSIASTMTFGGPPEFQTRPDGLPGLKDKYGVVFKNFQKLDAGGPLTVNALKNGQVQAADLFTTDPSIGENNFVVLNDPKNDFIAQNVLPLIRQDKATAGVKQVLNAISGKLDTNTLTQLDKQIYAKQDPVQVADAWLKSSGTDPSPGGASGVSLTVGSANFQESVLLADIYAEALKHAGANVSTKLNIGSREVYIPAIKDGSIDLLPEYSGVLLQFFDKNSTASSADDVYQALQKALPQGLAVLDKSSAEDKDAVVVTKETAQKYNLSSIGDLAKPASS